MTSRVRRALAALKGSGFPRFASEADRPDRKWHQGLSRRLEIMRGEGAHRLATVAQYTQPSHCRSAFIRRYFVEHNPPICGGATAIALQFAIES